MKLITGFHHPIRDWEHFAPCLNKTGLFSPIITHALVTNLKTGIKQSTIKTKRNPSPLEFRYNQLLLDMNMKNKVYYKCCIKCCIKHKGTIIPDHTYVSHH